MVDLTAKTCEYRAVTQVQRGGGNSNLLALMAQKYKPIPRCNTGRAGGVRNFKDYLLALLAQNFQILTPQAGPNTCEFPCFASTKVQNTDAEGAARGFWCPPSGLKLLLYAALSFTSTKVQILTQKALLGESGALQAVAAVARDLHSRAPPLSRGGDQRRGIGGGVAWRGGEDCRAPGS